MQRLSNKILHAFIELPNDDVLADLDGERVVLQDLASLGGNEGNLSGQSLKDWENLDFGFRLRALVQVLN